MDLLIDISLVVMSVIVTRLFIHIRSAHGTLRIDHSDPKKDIYRLELDNLEGISAYKRVVLKIDHNANLSQE